MDSDLRKAIDLCESVGYKVIDKEWIKKLSFSKAESSDFLDYYSASKSELEKMNEEEALKILFNELKLSGLIKKTQREEPMFFQQEEAEGKTITITTWRLNILD